MNMLGGAYASIQANMGQKERLGDGCEAAQSRRMQKARVCGRGEIM